MAQHWQEMLPIDRYTVAASGLLHDYDRKVLTMLYQPLIGTACYSLYMTLWAELEENRLWSAAHSHHSLMNFMGMGLKEIHEARLKLEGIGLLKVYVRKDEDSRSFIYELIPPLAPEQFFLDGMLNIYLYRKIGKSQFARLKRFFSDQKLQQNEDYKEVTREFQDVFSSAHHGSFAYDSDMEEHLEAQAGMAYIGRREAGGIQVDDTLFNFDLLLAGLSDALVPKKALTKKAKEAISNLSFLYGIDAIQMKNIVMSAVNEDNQISIEELRKSARDWYQFQNQDQLPALVDRIQPALYQTHSKEPKSKEDELLHYLEVTSPRQLLKDVSGGAEPSKGDLQTIEDVMFQQKLLPGVVNVLIQYVMLKTDMKLTKGYVDKIASHWARKKIKTAKEAMLLAKNEHKQYMDWADGKKTAKKSTRKQPIRTELLPDWFDESSNEGESSSQKAGKADEELEMKRRELKETLKKLRSGEAGE